MSLNEGEGMDIASTHKPVTGRGLRNKKESLARVKVLLNVV